MAKREQRVTERFPRVGRLLLAVFDESPSTKAFKKGAEGERKAVQYILANAGDNILLLVNRRLGQHRRDGDVDILAITAAGVHVIDVKRYENAKVEVERIGGLLTPRVDRLRIRGRDATHFIDGIEKQVEAVQEALASNDRFAEVPVTAALCFVDAYLPRFGTPMIRGIPCLGRQGTSKWLRAATGALTPEDTARIWEILDRSLPPAS